MLLIAIFALPYINSIDMSTLSLEDIAKQHDNDKNVLIATPEADNEEINEDFYEDQDNWPTIEESMNVILFGSAESFLRIDAESMLHMLIHFKSYFIPINRVLLAWDLITDGKTAAFLQGREYMAFGNLLNVVPEEDLYYVNFAIPSVLHFFAKTKLKLIKRKYGVLVSSYRRTYGDNWYQNGTIINQLGYLFCGFPLDDIVKITPSVFRHIRGVNFLRIVHCNPEQFQALYNIAIHPDAYGRPYLWTSHDLTTLGYLITYIPNDEISSLNLEAVVGISERVMRIIAQNKLRYFSREQIMHMEPRARRLFIVRMKLGHSLTTTDIMMRHRAQKLSPLFLMLLTISCYFILLHVT